MKKILLILLIFIGLSADSQIFYQRPKLHVRLQYDGTMTSFNQIISYFDQDNSFCFYNPTTQIATFQGVTVYPGHIVIKAFGEPNITTQPDFDLLYFRYSEYLHDAFPTCAFIDSTYDNPAWINTLHWNKLIGKPTLITSETDPNVPSYVKNITSSEKTNWNLAYGWGNHASAGYLTSFTESDPGVPSYVKNITTTDKSNWNTSFSWGNHSGLYRPITYVPAWSEITSKPTFATIATSGLWADIGSKPLFAIVATTGAYSDLTGKPKVPIPYSGTTNSSGIYTVTFGVTYSAAPNIQVNLIGGTNKYSQITTVTTTGFSIYVQARSDALGLLPSYSNVNGGAVDVLITEK